MINRKFILSITWLGILTLQISLRAASSSYSYNFSKKTTKYDAYSYISIETAKEREVFLEDISRRVQHLRALGEIKNLNVLRRELKNYQDDEAWKLFNILGVGPSPSIIAQNNKFDASSILLTNFNRNNDPLFQAIMFGDKSKIGRILKANPDKLSAPLFVSTPPLGWAISLKDADLVRYFIKKGAKIDETQGIGLNPYFQARNIPEIHKLMRNTVTGKRVQAQEKLFKALEKKNNKKQIIALLTQSPDLLNKPLYNNYNPMRAAVTHNYVQIAKILIYKGALNNGNKQRYARDLFCDACCRV